MEQSLIIPHSSTAPSRIKVPSSPAAPPPTFVSTVVVRLASFAVLLAIALWANFEATKYFDIKVVNAAKHTLAGRQFHLMFVSNGRAERLILNASNSIAHILYPDKEYPRKPVQQVTLYLALAGQNSKDVVTVSSGEGSDEFVISLCPSAVASTSTEISVAAAVQLGMAQILLWDGKGKTPRPLLKAMVHYLAISAGLEIHLQHDDFHIVARNASCWEDNNYIGVARFLQYCGEQRHGFMARLNQAMKEDWNKSMVDAALGSSSQRLCSSYLSLTELDEDQSNFSSSDSEFHQQM